MDITKLDINDIAQNIDMGMLCFIHKETLELVHYPDPEQFYDDIEEHWGEDIKKIEANMDDYVRIKKMDSRASFRIMEDYTAKIKNKKLQSQLFNALSNRKPFRNWKHIIDHQDEERENWFKFKQERMEIWVKCHLDPQQKYEAETLYSIMTEKQEPLLQGIRSCIYMVDDLEKATRWYSTAFGIEPDIESKDYVAFNVGGFELGLQLSTTNQRDKVNSIITYWAVEDIEEALYQLQIVGAQEHQEITELGEDKKQASVIDSWGNIIGLICNPNFEIE